MKVINILVVCQRYYPEPFRITDICKGLIDRGHKVTVLTGLPNYPEGNIYEGYKLHKRKIEIIDGIKVIRCREMSKGSGSNVRLFFNYFTFMVSSSIKALFLNEDFDVIFSNQLSPVSMVVPAIILKRRKNKKLLIYCMDIWPASLAAGGIKEGSLIYKFFLKFSRGIYKSADNICVTSRGFKNYFSNVLDIDDTAYLPQYSEDIFKDYNRNDIKKSGETLDLVFAGCIGRTQGIDTIIKATKILKGKIPLKIHILGDGVELDNYKNLAKQLNVNDIVKFYGRKPVQDMPRYYSMADAMIVTLRKSGAISNTLPGKVQTYMAEGKPILGAADGETMDIINEAKCGFCCEAESEQEFAKVILKFYNCNNKEELGINSYKYYQQNFTREHFLNSLENKLQALI